MGDDCYERDPVFLSRDAFTAPFPALLGSESRVVVDQVRNDRMEQSAKDSIQKPPVKESEALLASEIGTGTPSFRQWEH